MFTCESIVLLLLGTFILRIEMNTILWFDSICSFINLDDCSLDSIAHKNI